MAWELCADGKTYGSSKLLQGFATVDEPSEIRRARMADAVSSVICRRTERVG